MKNILLSLCIFLIGFSIAIAQPYKVYITVGIPTDCNGGPDLPIFNESGQEGMEFLIPQRTLPPDLAAYQSYYDVFAGGTLGLEQGTLNENVTLHLDLEYYKCSPENLKLLDAVRMSIRVIGEKTGPHDVFTYYQFNEGKKGFIKLNAKKLFEYLEKEGVKLDELVAWFYGEGFTPDLTGITYKYDEVNDPEWFYIYLDHFSKIVLGKISSPTSIKNSNQIPSRFSLEQNYPNPFNPSTKISWQSPIDSWQTIKVYNVLGNEVVTLVNQYLPAGKYEVEFDASKLTSGNYFYKLLINDFVQVKKMLLIK